MKHYVLIMMLSLVMVACNEKDWQQPVEVSGIGETTTIDRDDEYNLAISGLNNTVSVAQDNRIHNLTISGYNNELTIGANTSVDSFWVTGSDNTVYVPAGSGITFEDTGYGNELIEQ
jgi:hypothetical protein